MKYILPLFLLLLTRTSLFAQSFTATSDKIIGVRNSSVKWGDFDGDGDLDLVVAGQDSLGTHRGVVKIYENVGGNFIHKEANLPKLDNAAVDWGDFDNDGDLDLVISGNGSGLPEETNGNVGLTQIYQNNAGIFTLYGADIQNVFAGDVHWVDFDNDNNLDLYITGIYSGENRAIIYRNEGGTFRDIGAPIARTHLGQSAWGDFDNDGDLDLIVSGFMVVTPGQKSTPILKLYRNDGGLFKEVEEPAFIGVYNSSVKWGDYDNDGDLDLLVNGADYTGNPLMVRIYQNQPCGFVRRDIVNLGSLGEVDWGDYDNDGDLDILVSADCAPCGQLVASITRIYQNNAGNFVDIRADIAQLNQGSARWGDFDNDGDLDFIVTGGDRDNPGVEYHNWQSIIYRNNLEEAAFKKNTPPSPPAGLHAAVERNTVTLSWQPSQDLETESKALSYNLYVQSAHGDKYFLSPLADPENGYRKVAAMGNAGQGRQYRLKNLPEGEYYWSVQAIDTGFMGSEFVNRESFKIKRTGVMVPNIITPDGDGLNDTFVITAHSGFLAVEIYNRWGSLVFKDSDYKNDWGAAGLSSGVYYYLVRTGGDCDANIQSIVGWLEVLK